MLVKSTEYWRRKVVNYQYSVVFTNTKVNCQRAPKRSVQKTYGNEIGGTEMVAPKRRDPFTNSSILFIQVNFTENFAKILTRNYLSNVEKNIC